ncbi:hypothetical protein BU15DRAFT_74115 [Melanogaster broomeanus]|nr:hypothetical protein BU15DRAFT_74115 [Melanogaster broomeanus]
MSSMRLRSSSSRPPSLAPIEERAGGSDSDDGDYGSAQSSNDEFNPDAARADDILALTNTTPKKRKRFGSSIASSQKQLVRNVDPNHGRCLVTNRGAPIEFCHLLPRATSGVILSKLERAWGIGYHKLNVDTRYNLMCLTADWHTLFDRSEWVLVPRLDVLQQLAKIYLIDEEFRGINEFRYDLVSTSTATQPICRFPDPENTQHETHVSPYDTLGTLTSHIHPHFVICNIQKLRQDELDRITVHLNDGRILLTSVLYKVWKREEPGPSRPSGHSDPPAQEGQGDFSPAAGDRPPGAGPSARSPSSDRSHGEASQGQMRAAEHIEGSDYSADSAAVEHGWDNSEDATWIKGIYHWRKEGQAASEGGWDPIVVNDGQLATYVEECARTPPPPEAWCEWQPKVLSEDGKSIDTSKFSSNDWAFWRDDAFLPR